MSGNNRDHPPLVVSVREGPELGRTDRPAVITKPLPSDYPLIDSDPHFKRVVGYARKSDYAVGLGIAAAFPATFQLWERFSPSGASRQSFRSVMRLSIAGGIIGGFLMFYTRSIYRFYGFNENRREVEMDMREMVNKVKRREPLYGKSSLTEYMQGVASRQSRYSGVFLYVIPWFNFVNHPHHGVDTAKYYRQAELELEEESKRR